MRIRTKNTLGFGLIVALMVAACAAMLVTVGRMAVKINEIDKEYTISVKESFPFHNTYKNLFLQMRIFSLTGDDAAYQKGAGMWGTLDASLKKMKELAGRSPDLPVLRSNCDPLEKTVVDYRSLCEETRRLIIDEKASLSDPRVVEIGKKRFTAYVEMERLINEIMDEAIKLSDESTVALNAEAGKLMAGMWIGFGLLILLCVVIAVVMSLSVTRPVAAMAVMVDRLASGDLTASSNLKNSDELGDMSRKLDGMAGELCAMMRDINQAAAQTAASSEELSATAQNISTGSQQQASAVEEISASVESLTASIQGVASNAARAGEVADETRASARSGGATVEKSVDGMRLINESSEKMTKIIGAIGQIASQTNLLALNAAIEAASAGEHGLGFAVVADEVRKLAERASQAAEEIAQLIKESTARVGDGSRLSNEVGTSLAGILAGIEKTASEMSAIKSATMEQSAVASEVSKGMESVSAVTEENSASAEEMSASAEEMSASAEELAAQAQKLQEMVGRFKTE